jgi:hypothetical protein
MQNMKTTTGSTSHGSSSSSNGLLTVTIASSTHPHGPAANDDDDDLLVDPDDPFDITQTKNGEYACIFLLSINSSPFAFAFPFQCVLVSFIHFSI